MPRTAFTKEVSLEEARDRFEALADEVQTQEIEVIVKRAGDTIVRILPPVSPSDHARSRFFSRTAELRSKFEDMPTRELESRIDEAVAAVRSQRKGLASA